MGEECGVAHTDSNKKNSVALWALKDPNVAKQTPVSPSWQICHCLRPSDIVFVCKSHYIDYLIKELGNANLGGNPTYTPTTLTKEEILDNHRSVLYSFGISAKDEELDRPSLYWIRKLHNCPFKQRHVVGSAKCSTKPLSKLLSCILSAVKIASELLATLATLRVVWVRCGFWRTLKIS